MESLEYWEELLSRKEKELGFDLGYKFVYGPWETLQNRKIAFLSLMPGAAVPNYDNLRNITEEQGNSFVVEEETTLSPLTDQFLRLAELLGVEPLDILTGVIAPFRASDWQSLSQRKKDGSLALGRQFWREPLSRPELELIFACSKEAAEAVVHITGASLDAVAPAGWGNVTLRRYHSREGKTIIHLPHLSRFKLLGRKPSEQAIRSILSSSADGHSRQ